MHAKGDQSMAKSESALMACFAAGILSHVVGQFGLPPARTLAAGSGTGGNLAMLLAHGIVSTIEMDEIACRVARGRSALVSIYGAATFRMTFLRRDLRSDRHIRRAGAVEQDIGTLEALRGLLATGDRMLITVPRYQWRWSAHNVFLQHKRRYTAMSLRKMLADARLRVERVSYFNMWLLPFAMLARLKDRQLPGGRACGTAVPTAFVNRALCSIFRSERRLLDWFDLPAGLSLLAVVRGDGFDSLASGGTLAALAMSAADAALVGTGFCCSGQSAWCHRPRSLPSRMTGFGKKPTSAATFLPIGWYGDFMVTGPFTSP